MFGHVNCMFLFFHIFFFGFHSFLIRTCLTVVHLFYTFKKINKALSLLYLPFSSPFCFLEHTSFLRLISYFYFLLCVSRVFHCLLPVHVFVVFVSLRFIFRYFRYFFPPLDPPGAGTRYGHLLPPSSLIEHCDAEPIQPQQQALPHRLSSRALLSLPEAEGQ